MQPYQPKDPWEHRNLTWDILFRHATDLGGFNPGDAIEVPSRLGKGRFELGSFYKFHQQNIMGNLMFEMRKEPLFVKDHEWVIK